MNYTKPEITSLASASSVIQNPQMTKRTQGADSNPDSILLSTGAYAADE